MSSATAKHRSVDVIIVGAGQSGLAMSACLAELRIEHLLLEKHRVANAWFTQRWNSLRLLTPNWLTRLPGRTFVTDDPYGFARAADVGGFVESYAASIRAPVICNAGVERIACVGDGYHVSAAGRHWSSAAVVMATGAFARAHKPALASEVPDNIFQLDALDYKRPDDLPAGGVLVVGASATGVQLAQELRNSGRQVTLAVGEHVRLPRHYRGHDIQWWLHTLGLLDDSIDDVDDPARVQQLPSPQLSGNSGYEDLDLNVLQASGVEIVGRLAGMNGRMAYFSGALPNVCKLADLKCNRLLASVDEWIQRHGIGAAAPASKVSAIRLTAPLRTRLALDGRHVASILWATGCRPDFHFLESQLLAPGETLKEYKGVCEIPGLYTMGHPFMHRRKSSFIHGAEDDARYLASRIQYQLESQAGKRMLKSS